MRKEDFTYSYVLDFNMSFAQDFPDDEYIEQAETKWDNVITEISEYNLDTLAEEISMRHRRLTVEKKYVLETLKAYISMEEYSEPEEYFYELMQETLILRRKIVYIKRLMDLIGNYLTPPEEV